MFEQTLSVTTKKSLEGLAALEVIQDAYLAGGTALALQIGHRYSYDLDFFTDEKFDEKMVTQQISEALPNFTLERQSWRTILGFIDDIQFGLFFYKYPLLFTAEEFDKIQLAHLKDIAAMKLQAIAEHGTKRDFIDLYFLLQEKHVDSLEEILEFYNQKFGKLAQNQVHIIKSLAYFEDADPDAMPQMIKQVAWKHVKKFFKQEQDKLARNLL